MGLDHKIDTLAQPGPKASRPFNPPDSPPSLALASLLLATARHASEGPLSAALERVLRRAAVPPSPLKARCCYCTGIYREGREPITDGIDPQCERLLKTERFDIGRCLDCGKAARGLFCSPQHRDAFLDRTLDDWGEPLVPPQETLRPEGVRPSPSVSPSCRGLRGSLAFAGRRVTR